jgi:nucleotide-binding universal stress UspA family protein
MREDAWCARRCRPSGASPGVGTEDAVPGSMRIASILVPTDFGESSQRALDHAVELARKFDAKLTLLHSFEVPAYAYVGLGTTTVDYLVLMEESARKGLEDALRDLKAKLPSSVALFKKGAPWQQTLLACEETRADLIVMGTHGRQGLSHALIGSVTEKVVRLSPIPVLTVREPRAMK